MAELVPLGEGRYALGGDLDGAAVATLWPRGRELFDGRTALRVDLAGVGQTDSAGVALLVYWRGQAARCRQSLQFVNIPPQMRGLIRVAGLENLLSDADH